jgi:hypothetical protein
MREHLAGDRDRELRRRSEVGLRRLAGPVPLREHDFALGPLRGPPLLHAPLQCPQLALLVPIWLLDLQQLEQRLGLQRRLLPQPGLDRGPVVLERIRSRPPLAWRLHLRRQLAGGHVLASCLPVHARLHGGLADRAVLVHFLHQLPHLRVADRGHSGSFR